MELDPHSGAFVSEWVPLNNRRVGSLEAADENRERLEECAERLGELEREMKVLEVLDGGF